MEYIIIGLLVVILIISVISLMKNVNESNITERLGKLETNTIKELGDFKSDINKNLNEDFINLSERLDLRIKSLNEKVNERIDENFDKTSKTFNNVLERLTKIDEAQKKIDNLSSDIISLQSILTDKKTRGIFGEINLKNILENIFGPNNDKIYKLQYTLPNGTIADSILFTPKPLGNIAIDSKFPLENFQRMMDKKLSKEERMNAEKLFISDMKKHIDAISNKYIIPNITADQAILFLPAEAIFAEINAYYPEIITYSYKKRVWITSPTTLISTLTTIQIIIKNIERDKHANVIHKELNMLGIEFKRYKDRWDKLYRSIETVSNDVKDIHTTTNKITKKFDALSNNEIDDVKKLTE